MIRRFRRLKRGAAIAGVTALSGSLALVAAVPAHAATTTTTGFAFTRIAGANRFGTAAALATQAFPNGAATAIIATGFNFPDALAGNYLAGQDNAPILLVNATGTVPAETMQALQTLKTKNVIILGLQAAVGDDVAAALAGTSSSATGGGNITVTRIGGATRYDTANLVDEAPGAAAVGTFNGKKTAFLARGDNFPDALGAGAVAFARHFPIILTDPNTLSPQAIKTIADLGIQQLIVLGGTAAVSTAVETGADTNGVTTLVRLSGATRSDTSRLLADYAITNLGFLNTRFSVASGDDAFGGADALASGPFSGSQNIPTLITNSVGDPGAVVTFATEHSGSESSGFAIGGTAPLPDATLVPITSAISGNANAARTTLPTLVSAAIVSTTTANQSNGANPAGTVVRYVFSQNVSAAVFNAAGFHAYDAAGNRYAPASVFVDPGNSSAFIVRFTGGGTPNSADLTTTSGAAGLTLATVGGVGDPGTPGTAATPGTPAANGNPATPGTAATPATAGGPAVTTPAGSNPDGSAPIGTSSTTTASAAGVTAAPDPESFTVTQTGGASMAGLTPVNVTFDQPAIVQTAGAATPGSGFSLVFTLGASTQSQCTGPTNTTTASGGTVAGGNGTTTLTILCANQGSTATTPGTTITAGSIARVVVAPGTVGTAAAGTTFANGNATNPLEVTDTPHGTSDGPDLTSVAFIPGSGGTADQVVYTFDAPVSQIGATAANGTTPANPTGTGNATGFSIYNASGQSITCGAPMSAAATGTVPCTVARNSGNFNQLVVSFGTTGGTTGTAGTPATAPTGSNVTMGAVGGSVARGTVTNANSPATNGDDEQGGTNPNNSSTAVTPGTVNAPQLTTVHIASVTNALGTNISATYTFSQPVTLATASGLHLYNMDGTELTCNGGASATTGSSTGTTTQVTCTSFSQGTAAGGTAATGTQLTNAVLGTADFGTVTGNTTNGPGSTNSNPEGGINVS